MIFCFDSFILTNTVAFFYFSQSHINCNATLAIHIVNHKKSAQQIRHYAKKNLVKISLRGTTIPHEIIGKYGAGSVLMKPAAPGTGVIAGGPVRAVVEMAGIKDIRTKSLRSNNPCNVVRATIQGLSECTSAKEVAEKRGKSVKEILG